MPGSPTVRVSSLDHDMGITSLPIEPVAIGSYRAVGSLSMEGRWRFQIEMPGDQTEMFVTLQSEGELCPTNRPKDSQLGKHVHLRNQHAVGRRITNARC